MGARRGFVAGSTGSRIVVRAAVVASVLTATSVPLLADVPRGVEFGKSKISTSIKHVAGQTDTDMYVAPLIAGEVLSVKVAAAKKSLLRPTVAVVDPDGNALAAGLLTVKTSKKGNKVSLKKFVVPRTGVWGVRVGGADGTQGEYVVSTKIKGTPKFTFDDQTLAAGTTADHPFGGFDGALLTATVKPSKNSSSLSATALLDPSGDAVPGGLAAVTDKNGRLSIKKLPLSSGVGDYVLRVGTTGGAGSYKVKAVVKPVGRPSTGRKPLVLSSDEPFLDAIGVPLRGIDGTRVRATGARFSTTGTVRVFVGGVEAGNVTAAGDGASVLFDMPAVTPGSLNTLVVQNADGQTVARADYVLHPLPPTLTAIEDGAGETVTGGSTDGGQVRVLRGTSLALDGIVRFGANTATLQSQSPDETAVTVTTPAGAAGDVTVLYLDAFGRSATTSFTYKTPPAFGSPAFDPPMGAAGGATVVELTGANLRPEDELQIGGVTVPTTWNSATSVTFTLPAIAAGMHATRLTDAVGTTVSGPTFETSGPPTITTVEAVSGTFAAPDELPLAGGATIRVTGTGFRPSNTVELGGGVVTAGTITPTSFTFTAPASAAFGSEDLVVTDPADQSGTATDALSYVGFEDATTLRAPAGTATDEFSAIRGVLGDLDGDGNDDDVVLGSFYDVDYPPGTRDELTRLLRGDGTELDDVTDTRLPSAFSDPTGEDDWRTVPVAIGDIDGSNGPDIVTAGPIVDADGYYSTDVRVFTNGGTGSFSFSAGSSAISVGNLVYAYDTYYSASYPVFIPEAPAFGLGVSTSIAIGDLDGDNDLDVVVGSTRYRAGYATPPGYVTFTPGNYSSYYYAGYYYNNDYMGYYYASALLVFDNDVAGGNALVDVSFPRVPLAGTIPSTERAFPAFDVRLGDLDGDNDLDIALTWPDPLTTTPYGLYTSSSPYYSYTSADSARISGAVLTNDGNGFFTDATSSFLPAPSGNEFWQGHRLELADLDNDTDLDMVVLHGTSIDDHTSSGPTFTASALRVLRNNGSGTPRFSDVTSSAIPSVPLPGTADDNLRGTALRVVDVNGDGLLDILVGTTEALTDAAGDPVHCTRLLIGRGNLRWVLGNAFLPPADEESGEADDLLLGDIDAGGARSLVFVSLYSPYYSATYEYLRVWDWTTE